MSFAPVSSSASATAADPGAATNAGTVLCATGLDIGVFSATCRMRGNSAPRRRLRNRVARRRAAALGRLRTCQLKLAGLRHDVGRRAAAMMPTITVEQGGSKRASLWLRSPRPRRCRSSSRDQFRRGGDRVDAELPACSNAPRGRSRWCGRHRCAYARRSRACLVGSPTMMARGRGKSLPSRAISGRTPVQPTSSS